MRPSRTLVALAALLLLVPATVARAAEWTFLVYLDADNDLESDGIEDFLEMASVGSDDHLNIVVQMDRIAGFDRSYGDWTGCRRFQVTPGMTPAPEASLQDLGEINMGDPGTLTDFIDWGTAHAPAERYALVLWDHGDGWRSRVAPPSVKAVCGDTTSGGDALSTKEVRSALAAARTPVDLLGFDACLMGMIEVAYEVREAGPAVMVASEDNEPLNGWPYHTLLADLAAYPALTPAQLGAVIVERYWLSYGRGQTQAAVDLGQIQAVADGVRDLAGELERSWDSDPGAVQALARSVTDALDGAVLHERHGAHWPGVHGLAVYFPPWEGGFDPSYNGTVVDFAEDAGWAAFLDAYHAEMAAGSWVADARDATQQFSAYGHVDLYDFCDRLADAGTAFDLLEPADGAALGSPPTFSWSAGRYDAFLFCSVFRYDLGFWSGYFPSFVRTGGTSLVMPASWWQKLGAAAPCYWVVVGADTSTTESEASETRSFTRRTP